MDQKETDPILVHILTIEMRPYYRMGMSCFAKMIARHSLASFSKEKYIRV